MCFFDKAREWLLEDEDDYHQKIPGFDRIKNYTKGARKITRSFFHYLVDFTNSDRKLNSQYLETEFNISGAEVRAIINVLRRSGKPICSDQDGYWFSEDITEIRSTIDQLKGRICGMSAAITGLVEYEDQYYAEFPQKSLNLQ